MTSMVFTSSTGRKYDIEIDDFGEEITVSINGQKCGSISLEFHDGDERSGIPDFYKITYLALDACKGQGVGQKCLELHKRTFETILTAGRSDVSRSEDATHLIDDGPGFIENMRKKGIVCRENDYNDSFDDE